MHVCTYSEHVLEQRLEVDLLLVVGAERHPLLLADDRDDGRVVELRVVEAVQQVDRARPGGRHADADLAGELRVAARHERGHLLVARLDELGIAVGAVERAEEAVDAVARDSRRCGGRPTRVRRRRTKSATSSAMALLSADTLKLLPRFRAPKRFALRYIFVTVALALGLAAAADAARRPAIAGTDVLTGKHVALSQFGGKPVFVSVWGSWCDGCKTEAPTLARFVTGARAARSRSSGSTRRTRSSGARAFGTRYGTEYPSIWDPRGMLAGAWSRGAPTTLVFDRQARARQADRGNRVAGAAERRAEAVASTRR